MQKVTQSNLIRSTPRKGSRQEAHDEGQNTLASVIIHPLRPCSLHYSLRKEQKTKKEGKLCGDGGRGCRAAIVSKSVGKQKVRQHAEL